MNDANHILILDLHHPQIPFSIHAKKGDTAKILKVKLTDNGEPYTIGNDCYAVFSAKKPDGNIIFNACEIADNVISYRFTPQTCAVPGEVPCEVRLYGANDKLITSPGFLLTVEDAVYTDGDVYESSTEASALTLLIDQTRALTADIEEKLAENAYANAHSAVCFTPQDLPDSQKIQARANIGAAPAGFGLGAVQSIEWDEIDTVTTNGWYCAVVNDEIAPSAPTYMTWVRVDALDANYACQTAYITSSDYILQRQLQGGVWSQWCWINPPMYAGVEYRTTELWRGKPVYTKLIDCGAIADKKEIAHGVSATNILRYSGTMSDLPMPVFINEYYQAQASITNTAIILHVTGYTGYPATVQLWYTKD